MKPVVAAWETSMMHLSVPTAAPVIVTWPAFVTVQPTLPVPVAKLFVAGLLEVARRATRTMGRRTSC